MTAAELLSVAAYGEGKNALAFPTFGSERTGAPVTAFCRISDRPIRSREPIVEPDALIVQDPTLLHQVDVFGGVGGEAYVLLNTGRSLAELGLDEFAERFRPERVVTVPATELARDTYHVVASPTYRRRRACQASRNDSNRNTRSNSATSGSK